MDGRDWRAGDRGDRRRSTVLRRLYNVAASEQDNAAVAWASDAFVRRQSMAIGNHRALDARRCRNHIRSGASFLRDELGSWRPWGHVADVEGLEKWSPDLVEDVVGDAQPAELWRP